jgi:hypothetical protein
VKRSRSGRVIKPGRKAKDERGTPKTEEKNGKRMGRATEQLFCVCQKPWVEDEEDEMIACDGEDCPYEWYHLECAGVKAAPKGRFFCDTCKAKQTGRKRRKVSAA